MKEFRIVQLTDVHVGRVIRRSFVQRIVKRVNSLQPDVIVITGDLIDSEPASLQEHLEPLAELKAPAGVFFVAGNHEYIHDLNKSVRAVEELGITPLLDESVLIQDPDQQQPVLQLVGLLDYMGYRMGEGVPDPQQAFARIKTDLPVVVLAHQPVMIQKLEDYPVDLVLSGHTHGGQIFPFSLLVKLAQPYLAGLYGHDDSTRIYVSRGTGFWGPPIRVLAPSEITLLRLRPVRN